MYSSNGASPAPGAVKLSVNPAFRYSGVAVVVHPASHPDGQDLRRRQVFVPVSNAVTGATSTLRPHPSL